MDAFFASVEQACNPNLRGKPVAVGGGRSGRGVVTTASYEARAFGLHAGMPVSKARRLCPDAIFIEGDPEKYVAYAREIFRLLRDFTPIVEPWSVDEAFLDMTATADRFGGALASGAAIRARIREQFGLATTVGIAPNKLLAKLVSGLAKPDGLRWLREEEVPALLETMPVGELWGIGEKTAAFLAGLGIRTVGELGRASRADMGRRIGVVGERLVFMGQGRDDTPVVPYYEAEPPKSMGHETTLARNLHTWDEVERTLLWLSDKVARRMRVEGYRGRTVTARVRFASFRTIGHSRTLGALTDEGRVIFAAACALVRGRLVCGGAGALREPVRLLGVSCANLAPRVGSEMHALLEESARERAGTRAADAVRDRFGEAALLPARLIEPPSADSPAIGRRHHVPFMKSRNLVPDATQTLPP
jgi:DNA polymerase-4